MLHTPSLYNKTELTEKEQRLKNSLETLNLLSKDVQNF
jgi:hypothetical protein